MRSARSPWLLLLGSLMCTTPALADWPVPRHDPQRTGTSPHRASLAEPTVAWRYHLGADLWTDALTTLDTDGDGIHEIVFVEGRRVVARTADDSERWSTAIDGVAGIPLVADLDGDGREELVVTASSGFVYLLGAADGAVLWQSPHLGEDTPDVRVGDVDDDPLPELVADTQRQPDHPLQGSLLFEYDPARGDGDGFPIRHWWTRDRPGDPRTDLRERSGGNSVTFADVDGDGRDEVVVVADYRGYVYRGADGLKLRRPDAGEGDDGGHPLISPGAPGECPIGVRYGLATSSVYDRPGGGQGVLYANDRPATGRQLFTVEWDAAADRLVVARHWRVPVMTRDRHQRIDDALVDLDGDGHPEIVTGADLADRGEQLRILGTRGDAALGIPPWPAADCDAIDFDHALLGAIRDVHPTGIWRDALPDADGRLRPLVLAVRDDTLIGYRMARADRDGRVAFEAIEHFQLQGHGRVGRYDFAAEPGGSARGRPTHVALPDGRSGLLVSGDGRLALLGATADGFEVIATLPLEGRRIFRHFVHRDLDGRPGLVLLRDDARLMLVDADLEAQRVPGLDDAAIRVRAYSGAVARDRGPLAASFDGRADEVVVERARGGLARIDARAVSRGGAVREVWRWDDVVDPALWDLDADGVPEIIAHHDDALEARRADGRRVLFRTPALEGAQGWLRSTVPGVDARDPHGVRLHSVASDRTASTSAVLTFTSDGALDWTSPWIPTAQSNLGYATADDADGDGVAEVFVGFSSALRWLDGLDGALRRQFGDRTPEWTLVTRGLVEGVDYLKVGGALVGYRRDPPTLREVFRVDDFVTSEPGVALLDCGDRYVVAGTQTDTHRLIRVDAADGRRFAGLHLAGGRAYADPAAVPPADAGARLGPTSGIAALYGDRPAVVVGSTDGHLYAVDPCPADAPELIWALDLGRPVGVPIFADTDGDGAEELVVPVADGYLYGIDTAGMPAPAWAHDVAAPDALDDVDETETDALHFAWAEVPGAVAYSYTVLDADQRPLTEPLRTLEPRARYADGLVFGARYRVAVRAIGAGGISPETRSDGVRWLHDRDACADRDGDGVCAADDCHPDDPARFPGGDETCHGIDGMDGIDDDCDGVIDEGCPCFDADGDGLCPEDGDCDDADPSTRPGLVDRCDGWDADCDGRLDEDADASCCFDRDRDGTCDDLDCAPDDPARHPGAADTCDDPVDLDCDGAPGPLDCDLDCDGFCPGDGPRGGDCDDADPDRHPLAVERAGDGRDDNCDGADNPSPCDADGDGFCPPEDCDDADPARNPAAVDDRGDGVDQDCNGVDGPLACDLDGDGFCPPADCAPDDPAIHPAAPDHDRDGVDRNCDGFDGPLPCDADGDGHCPPADCADDDTSRHPGADEGYDGVDDDCDGRADEGLLPACEDADEDGACAGVDCADDDPARHPGAEEIEDGVDDDCDGAIDEGFPVCVDADRDGACVPFDCDDDDPTRRPDMPERLDGADDDCDGAVDEGAPPCPDADADGACDARDCQPMDPEAHPGAAERPGDGLDDDCDGAIDEFVCVDADRDGACADFDCDDADPEVRPGLDERDGNGADDDCDGLVDEFVCVDADRDGACADADCDDGDPHAAPGLDEVPDNGADDDCDGEVDEAEPAVCQRPDGGAPGEEFCGNGLDDDCDGITDEGCGAARRGADGCAITRPGAGGAPTPWLLALLAVPALRRRAR